MSKTDTLTPIGHTLETFDGQAGVTRTWRVIRHEYVKRVGRVVAVVVLEGATTGDEKETNGHH